MGGFTSQEGYIIHEEKQLPVYISAIKAVAEEDITDRSKADALSKGVAIAQAVWFIVQCVARASQGLPVAELEIATMRSNVVFRPDTEDDPLPVRENIIFRQGPSDGNPVDFANYLDVFQGAAARVVSLSPEYWPVRIPSVGAFQALDIDSDESYVAELKTRPAVFAAAAIFGGIHCAAWHTLFASTSEMWMWRISSVVVTAYPILIMLAKLGADSRWDIFMVLGFDYLKEVCIGSGISLYPVCRIVLIVLSFTTLRALTASDFVDVDWPRYIPHF
ncbi:hypothetical protein C8F04DRAFT_1261923 [Mycena alexandri]|uniref:Uncharacterized protein n=1 Tax=Mycena alexandri TaxID=1745969 RepID=A0AAD6WYP9_9AGAR|nr:hypothetical protein C8F04DRAFT_1261923 [Mycena alexandri]